MELGKLGVWISMDGMRAAEAAEFARRVEAWGYCALWIPESRGRNALVHSAWLLAHTKRLIVATGIANIYARDAMAMANGQRALAEQSDGRFLLGLGVSHAPSVEGVRGHTYDKPVATMRAYLEAMRDAPYGAPTAREAADDPRGARAAHDEAFRRACRRRAPLQHRPRNIPRRRAGILGPGKLLCPEVWVLRETDPAKARSAGARRSSTICGSRITSTAGAARALATMIWPAAAPTAFSTRYRLGRRGGDPRPHPAALGRRRRPCLHPVDQPEGSGRARRTRAGAAGAGALILTSSCRRPTLSSSMTRAAAIDAAAGRRARAVQ